MTDLELPEITRLLSVPAASLPGQVSRRRFLQGTLAAGTIASAPSWFDRMAEAATPVGANEGIVIVIHLGGGNDGINTVVPTGDSAYRSLRGSLALPSTLPLKTGFGLHPALPGLKARFDAGQVAIVQGVGQATVNDLSHFSSTASWMAGTSGASRSTGWLGRWLDGVPESAEGLRAVTVGSAVPLHLVGQQSTVTALDLDGDLFGADRSEPWMGSVYDTVTGFGAGPTGKGVWADRIARAGAASIGLADDLEPTFHPSFPNGSLASQLTLVARLINANVGVRVFNVSMGSFDTHEGQLGRHSELLGELDAGITAFYAALGSTWRRRVALLTFSEFGRRPEANGSAGTDHGTSSVLFVIGDNVKGGFHGESPKLNALDSRGDPLVTVDYRAVYAAVLSGWLGADPASVLGAAYPGLTLFAGGPGTTTPVPPVTTGPWVPFATPTDLVRQLFLDLYGRVGDASGVTYWARQLTTGRRTISGVIDAFLHSTEFGRSVAPVARLAVAALGAPPTFDDLMAWAALAKAGTPVAAIAPAVLAKPAAVTRFGGLTDAAFVVAAASATIGAALPASERTTLVARLGAGTLTRPALFAELSGRSAAVTRFGAEVEVLMTYAGLLRRSPDRAGWAYWVPRVKNGTSVQRLIAQFFSSAEYRRRFAA